MRVAWFAACVLAAASVVTMLASFFAAAWWSDERFGGIGFILFCVNLVGLFVLGSWGEDKHPWESGARLGRSGRKALRSEQQRIALAQAIARAEEEAGIR